VDKRVWLRVALAAFVACVWLNQSVGGKDWEELKGRVFAAPAEHPVQYARYPFVFLYRRSADERIYFEAAGAMLGRAYDQEVLRSMRGRLPASFQVPLPPPDGRFHAPWREVPIEYPALLLPFVLLPRLVAPDFETFGYAFGALMGLCLVLAIVVALDLARMGKEKDLAERALLASGLLLAQGALAIQRLDAVTALALALGVHAAVRKKPLGVGLWIGIAGATKILPLLALPVIVASDLETYRAKWPRLLAGVSLALALGFVPMLAIAPSALGSFVGYHAARGLPCESTLGVLVQLGGLATFAPAVATPSFGSMNLEGPVASVFAKITLPLTLLSVAWLTLRAAKNKPRAATAALAACVALWLTGKVFSPQYMTWAIPLVLAVPGRRVSWGLVAAMALTQLYLRGYYDLVAEGAVIGVLSVAVRQGALGWLLFISARES
jgi:hypothetical protein